MSATVRSMTGYGRGEHIAEERKFTVEMKSVNHRYNDMTIKLPRSLASLEDKIKKRIMRDVFRGKTDVYISFETFSAPDGEIANPILPSQSVTFAATVGFPLESKTS